MSICHLCIVEVTVACVHVCVRLLNGDYDDDDDDDDDYASSVFYSLLLMVVLCYSINRGVLEMMVMMMS